MTDWLGDHVPQVVAVFAAVAFAAAATFYYRPVCADGNGGIREGAWRSSTTPWFVTEQAPVCENESLVHFAVGKIPGIGETLEQVVAGPDRRALRKLRGIGGNPD